MMYYSENRRVIKIITIIVYEIGQKKDENYNV